MMGLTIRKAFYDTWDNLGLVFLATVIFDLLLLIPVSLPGLLAETSPALAFAVQSAGIAICVGWAGAFSVPVNRIVTGRSPAIRKQFRRILRGFLSGLAYGVVGVAVRATVLTAFQFYGALGNAAGLIALAVVFWMTVAAIMIAGVLLPVRDQQDGSWWHTARQSALLAMDNPLFFLGVIVLPILGIVLIGVFLSPAAAFFAYLVFPGIGGWMVWLHVSVLLRSRKYEWLRDHPDAETGGFFRRFPWGEILMQERQDTGRRTIRSLFFPWKD